MKGCRLCPVSLGLSFGIVWGASILLMGIIATYYSYGRAFVTSFGLLYIGYEPTITGALIGGLIGFIDAFLGAFIIAMLYNLFNRHGCCNKKDGCN